MQEEKCVYDAIRLSKILEFLSHFHSVLAEFVCYCLVFWSFCEKKLIELDFSRRQGGMFVFDAQCFSCSILRFDKTLGNF